MFTIEVLDAAVRVFHKSSFRSWCSDECARRMEFLDILSRNLLDCLRITIFVEHSKTTCLDFYTAITISSLTLLLPRINVEYEYEVCSF